MTRHPIMIAVRITHTHTHTYIYVCIYQLFFMKKKIERVLNCLNHWQKQISVLVNMDEGATSAPLISLLES